jgi:hypothetical protein
MELSKYTKSVLKKFGWVEGRDISEQLIISEQKDSFPEAISLMSEFGFLKIEFKKKNQLETIYFDCDDSKKSEVLRANIFGYDDPDDPKLKVELDYMQFEDFQTTSKISEQIGECCRLGFYEDQLGHDIYVATNGNIYVAHGTKAFISANSFVEFLNNHIKEET